eukprot:gnl/Chilomastix_cuspidata/2824.p1 GENE.gnl/Chilomastix_cuspidata/2824~~gnl/Chilomastix_cuspidata/2824.p1  ORF type:complete len:295 (+),score=15.33 gnl/Chilomastix_cuspidata/2824:104-988(+)
MFGIGLGIDYIFLFRKCASEYFLLVHDCEHNNQPVQSCNKLLTQVKSLGFFDYVCDFQHKDSDVDICFSLCEGFGFARFFLTLSNLTVNMSYIVILFSVHSFKPLPTGAVLRRLIFVPLIMSLLISGVTSSTALLADALGAEGPTCLLHEEAARTFSVIFDTCVLASYVLSMVASVWSATKLRQLARALLILPPTHAVVMSIWMKKRTVLVSLFHHAVYVILGAPGVMDALVSLGIVTLDIGLFYSSFFTAGVSAITNSLIILFVFRKRWIASLRAHVWRKPTLSSLVVSEADI